LEGLTIQDKETGVFKRWSPHSEFAWAQNEYIAEVRRQYNAGKPVRIIVLKARQLGISTITAGIFFSWCFMHPGTSGVIIAHETETSEALFEKTQVYWDMWAFKDLYTVKHATQRRFVWLETRSGLRLATAKNVRSGRGRTLHVVHASEFAFWDDPRTLLLGLRQTIPNVHGTVFTIESTANGVGNMFHALWEEAVAGENEFVPMFFPWWRHYEYKHPISTIKYEPLDDEEKWLRSIGASLEGLEWRRWAIKNLAHHDLDSFKQEYPATAEEAFLHTGRNVFPLVRLKECYVEQKGCRGFIVEKGGKFRFVEDVTGPVTMFKWPGDKSWADYFVGGDPSHTTMGDRACAQVLNRRTLEQVAVWHGRIDPVGFAHELIKLGYFYNTAEMTTEIDGPGYATIGSLIEQGYANLWRWRWADRSPGKLSVAYGWQTNYQRKHQAMGVVIGTLGDMSKAILQGSHPGLIHDAETYHQMRNYVVLDSGEMGPGDPDGFDDACMAYAITLTCLRMAGPLEQRQDPEPYQDPYPALVEP
jgi:hypothetical protein